jgi:hypothetical protein
MHDHRYFVVSSCDTFTVSNSCARCLYRSLPLHLACSACVACCSGVARPRDSLLQVRALASLGHDILVISGKPQGHGQAQEKEGTVDLLEVRHGP